LRHVCRISPPALQVGAEHLETTSKPSVADGEATMETKIKKLQAVNRLLRKASFLNEIMLISPGTCIQTRGGSRGGAIGAISPPKPTKVTLFTMTLYNSENSIRDTG